jgi:Phosphatidyl serine synthase
MCVHRLELLLTGGFASEPCVRAYDPVCTLSNYGRVVNQTPRVQGNTTRDVAFQVNICVFNACRYSSSFLDDLAMRQLSLLSNGSRLCASPETHAHQGPAQKRRHLPLLVLLLVAPAALSFGRVTSLRAGLCALILFATASHPNPPRLFNATVVVAAALYTLAVLAAAGSSLEAVAAAIRFLDPAHTGLPLAPDLRTADCSLTAANVASSLDIYAVAHFVGHFVKAILLPSRPALLLSAVAFEFAEWALSARLPSLFPNLAECIWDRFLLDTALNAAGAETGLALMFVLRAENRSSLRPLHAGLLALTFTVTDISFFALKAALRLETQARLPTARIVLLCTLAAPAVRHYHQWCQVGKYCCRDFVWGGLHLAAIGAMLTAEALLCAVHIRAA